MSENTYLIKLKIAKAFDEPSVRGWAINCIGDQVAEGKATGPVWRGGMGPGHDNVGTFTIQRDHPASTEPQFAPPEKDLITLLDEIGSLAGKAYTLAQEQVHEKVGEVEEFALVLMQTYLDTGHKTDDPGNKVYWRDRAKKLLDAGYGKVE